MATFYHGSNAVFKLDDSGNTMTDLTSYVTSVTMSASGDTAETSTLGDSAKTYVAGLTDATISFEGIYDSTVDALLNGILGSDSISGGSMPGWEFGPYGSTAGRVKYSGHGILNSYEVEEPVDGAGTFSAELQVSGAITRATW